MFPSLHGMEWYAIVWYGLDWVGFSWMRGWIDGWMHGYMQLWMQVCIGISENKDAKECLHVYMYIRIDNYICILAHINM